MSLIEINPDFKLLLKELRRIATALEAHLLYAYDYRTRPVESSELGGEGPSADYSSNELTMKHEFEVAVGRVEKNEDVIEESGGGDVFE